VLLLLLLLIPTWVVLVDELLVIVAKCGYFCADRSCSSPKVEKERVSNKKRGSKGKGGG